MKNVVYHIAVFLTVASVAACSSDDDETVTPLTDKILFDKIKETGYVFAGNTSDTLPAKGPHTSFVRVLFNSVAAKELNSDGVLPEGKTFPENSFVVKEIFDKKGGNLTLYAVMMKSAKDENAKNGWLWAKYKPDGTVAYSISKKGEGCYACHASAPSRDNIKIFDAK